MAANPVMGRSWIPCCVGLRPRGFKSKAGRSRMNREVHVRFCEGMGVKFPRATRPLIHTHLQFSLAQDVGVSQRFSGLGNEPPQTGHTFSVGLIIRSALHMGYLTAWSATRLIFFRVKVGHLHHSLLCHDRACLPCRLQWSSPVFYDLM